MAGVRGALHHGFSRTVSTERVRVNRQARKVPVIAHCLTILLLIVSIRQWGVHPTEQERHDSERDVSIVPG